MQRREDNARGSSRAEAIAAVALLGALPAIALGIYLAGRGYVPDSPSQQAGDEGVAEEVAMPPQLRGRGGQAEEMADLVALLPRPEDGSAFKVSVPARQWPAGRMYEKIDGEDKVYLDAGCRGLAAMTLAKADDETDSIDVFLYQMTSPAAAEKVFAEQAPAADAVDAADRPEYVQIGQKAYTSHGSCFLRVGEFYLKLINNGESRAAGEEVLKLARRFADGVKDGP
jgi:hypothetical protein